MKSSLKFKEDCSPLGVAWQFIRPGLNDLVGEASHLAEFPMMSHQDQSRCLFMCLGFKVRDSRRSSQVGENRPTNRQCYICEEDGPRVSIRPKQHLYCSDPGNRQRYTIITISSCAPSVYDCTGVCRCYVVQEASFNRFAATFTEPRKQNEVNVDEI